MIDPEAVQKIWECSHEMGSPNYRLRLRLLNRWIPAEGKGHRALDAGCSTGGATRLLLERGYEVQGVDLSPYAIGRLGETLPPEQKSRFVGTVSDLASFEPAAPYRLIVLSEVLEHLNDDLALLSKARQWLSPGGKIVITVPADPDLWSDADRYSGHYRRYSAPGLQELIERAGLRAEALLSYGFPFLWVYTRLRNRWVRVESMERVLHASRGKGMGAALRAASLLLGAAVSLDRFFVGHEKGVGLMAVAREAGGGR